MRFHWFAVSCAITLVAAGSLVAQPAKPGGVKTYDGQPSAVWLARLKDNDATVRLRAAYALGQIKPPSPETVPALIKAVDDRAQEVRWYSADSLGRLGPAAKAGVAVLLAGVKDPANDQPFSVAAAQALGRIGPAAEEAVPWLVETLRDEHAPLRIAAALALWRIEKHPNSLAAFTESLAEPTGEGSYLASMALLEMGADARPADRALVEALGHPSADARRAAARVLGKLGPELIAPLSKALTGTRKIDKESALAALAYLLDDLRKEILYNSKVSADDFAAAEQQCVETALPALLKLFGDPNDGVRSAAARTAAKIGLPAIPNLLAALSDPTAQVRVAAEDALTRLEDELPKGTPSPHLAALQRRLVAPLVASLRHREPAIRAPALRLFAELTWGAEAQEALPLLRDALKSEDALTRRNAAKALEQVLRGADAGAGKPPGTATDPR